MPASAGQWIYRAVVQSGVCDAFASDSTIINVNAIPVNAGSITGSTMVCQGQTSVNYIVPAITYANSYIWTLPSGATGISTTNSINVNYGSSATSGNITVRGSNACGNGVLSSLAIIVNPLPAIAAQVSGPNTVCQGANNLIYSVTHIQYADSYIWSYSGTGATITGSDTTVTISFSFNATSGGITVVGHNACGNGGYLYFNPVNILTSPVTPVIIQNVDTLISNAATGNQWYNLTTGIINSATASKYLPQQTGNYFTIVTLNGCSSDSSNIIHFNNTGIKEVGNQMPIKIYPNPVLNELFIEKEGNKEQRNFEILNAIGQIIFKGNLLEKTIVETLHFSKGVYLIKFENGKSYEFKKIVKE